MTELQRRISEDLGNNREDPFAIYMQAKLLEKMKMYSAAIESYDRALQLDSKFVSAAYAKAACESMLGRVDDAI